MFFRKYHKYSIFFFFQAEDGIRDGTVTGVQTCALPISGGDREASRAGLGGAPRLMRPEGIGEEAPRYRPRAGDVCPGGGHWAGARLGRRRRGPGAAFLPEPGVDSLQPTGP